MVGIYVVHFRSVAGTLRLDLKGENAAKSFSNLRVCLVGIPWRDAFNKFTPSDANPNTSLEEIVILGGENTNHCECILVPVSEESLERIVELGGEGSKAANWKLLFAKYLKVDMRETEKT